MKKKQLRSVLLLCGLLLFLGVYAERTDRRIDDQNRIIRGSPGESKREVELVLEAEGEEDKQDYTVTVLPEQADKEQAQAYFAEAEEEIDASFFAEGENAEHVTQPVQMEDSYADGIVEANWILDRYDIVDAGGGIRTQEMDGSGELVQATASLTCGRYSEEYTFSFRVYPEMLSAEEALLQQIDAAIAEQNTQEGSSYLTLPMEAGGAALHWSEKKQHLVGKILFFEVIVLVLLALVKVERKKTEEKERREQMTLDYADVVSKLLLLLGAGMSLKQSWNKISAQYSEKRQKNQEEQHYIYEEMLLTNRAILDGESERRAYQKFGERVGLGMYQRLIRILLQNMQTGSGGLCTLLEQEAETALEERKASARKLGEEAGTKMLLPLMLMLGIVIAIIMVPAVLSFQV